MAVSNTSVRNSTVPPMPAGSPVSVKLSANENDRSVRAVWVSIGIWRDLQITQAQPGGRVVGVMSGQVLPRQQHLDQWVMGQASGRVEPLDQHLERYVLMLIRGHAALSHLGKQVGKTGIAVEVDPQNQGVDEESDQVVECGVAAPGDREPHCDIRTGAHPGQQHRKGGLDHHEAGRVVLAGHLPHPLLQLRRPLNRHTRAAMIGHRRIRPIGRQRSRSGIPVSASCQYASCAAIGLSLIVEVAELRALPQRVIDVLQRQFSPFRGLPAHRLA